MPYPSPDKFSKYAPTFNENGFLRHGEYYLAPHEIKTYFVTTQHRNEIFQQWLTHGMNIAARSPNARARFAIVGPFLRMTTSDNDQTVLKVFYEISADCNDKDIIISPSAFLELSPFVAECPADSAECVCYQKMMHDSAEYAPGRVWTEFAIATDSRSGEAS
jgi:hypothetical protein